MRNRNTTAFWNRKLKVEKNKLFKSPVFLHKNVVVLSKLIFSRGRLLDVGLGYGVIESILDKYNNGIELFGIDISNKAIEGAKNKYRGSYRIASATSIPFQKEYFDFVVALDVLEHLYAGEARRALKEISRVAKRGGTLIVSVPINESTKDRRSNRHLTRYGLGKLQKRLEANGFKINRVDYLTAFRNFYLLKHFINTIFHIRKQNLMIVVATKWKT